MLKKLAYILATGLGSGYIPRIPGTAASFTALLTFYLVPLKDSTWLAGIVILYALGLWSSSVIEKEQGTKDPPQVVIDEWAGQLLALLYLPRIPIILLAGFIIFRIMDILKPFPAGNVQRIKGGLGIMTDDIIAALYANLIIRVILLIFPPGLS